jgi:glycosyltransferase involved in cell wall biosynthesis
MPRAERNRSETDPAFGTGTVAPSVKTVSTELILPCLDEADGLRWLLPRVPPDVGVILVDNGSADDSAAIAAAHGARVISAPQRGYGAACHAGLLAASAELVAVMDADGTCDPADLGRLVAPVVAEDADLVVGARRPVSRRAQPWRLRLANRVLAARLNKRTGLSLHDLGPMRAARRLPLLELGLRDRRSGYPAETLVRAADAGWRIDEIWVEYRERHGRSKITGTARGTWQAVRDLSAVIDQPT